jgi:hypothetical protein
MNHTRRWKQSPQASTRARYAAFPGAASAVAFALEAAIDPSGYHGQHRNKGAYERNFRCAYPRRAVVPEEEVQRNPD